MSGDLVGDYTTMRDIGGRIRSAGYAMDVICPSDATGNGHQGIELAVQEFGLRLTMSLPGAQAELTTTGQLAVDSAGVLQATDEQLAG